MNAPSTPPTSKPLIVELDAHGISVKPIAIGGEDPQIALNNFAVTIRRPEQAQALIDAIKQISAQIGWQLGETYTFEMRRSDAPSVGSLLVTSARSPVIRREAEHG